MYNNNYFLFVNKIVLFFFFVENNKIRNGKIKFGKCKDWKIVRVRKLKGQKMYQSEEYGKVQK